MRITERKNVEYSIEEQNDRDNYKFAVTYDDLRKFLLNNKEGFELTSDIFPKLDKEIFLDTSKFDVIQNKKVQNIKYGLEIMLEKGNEYIPSLPNHVKCLRLANEYIREINSTPSKIYRFLRFKPITLVLRKIHDKKVEKFYKDLENYYTYACGVTPKEILITNKNGEQICLITETWQNYVDEKRASFRIYN